MPTLPPILTQTVIGNLVTSVVSGFLALFGLPAIVADPPVTPPNTPVLWAVLAWVRKEFQETLFNRKPVAHPAQTSETVDGVVSGNLGATDAEEDPLTYKLAARPSKGSVVVNADGTYAYTAGAELLATGGTDVFYVRVGEANDSSHINGLSGLFTRTIRILSLGLINVEGTSVRVEVTVPAPTPAPALADPGELS